MEFGKSDWRTFERGIEKEWLLTNGIGGFASSTLIGANTRRYHGLLVASLRPPVRRHLILSKLDESLILGEKTYNLYSHRTPGHTMEGFRHLQRVLVDHLPVFTFSTEDVFIEKTVSMVYGENTVCVLYHVFNPGREIRLRLAPLVNFRDYHHTNPGSNMDFKTAVCESGVIIKPYGTEHDIGLFCGGGTFEPLDGGRFRNMEYPVEMERGLDAVEDHYIPGYFEIEIKNGEDADITFIATLEKDRIKGGGAGRGGTDGRGIIEAERKRIRTLAEKSGVRDEFAAKLVEAADAFIAYRKSTDAKTVIAGYPWFTDWGRDAMISIPGLTLATGRYEDARQILLTFSGYLKDGLLPNMFPDEGETPGYNSVDAPLWYFEAVAKYADYTGDFKFIRENLYEGLKSIAGAYIKGTRFDIRMDGDCLITAGSEKTQLTWMDAKAGDRVFTPRHGKAVEINALWYNALCILAVLSRSAGDSEGAACYMSLADKVKSSFEALFWNEEGQCLYDVVTGGIKDARVRPNQVFAVSLSNPVLEGEKARKVLLKVWRELYTAYGLRSLAPGSPGYKGIYAGNQYLRDGAYHQGTVWTWPLGHFISGFIKAFGNTDENRRIARRFLEPFRDHLRDGCIGSVSEIFDADEPHIPRGCFAQAWSVAEVLRAYVENVGHVAPGRLF